MNWEAKCQAERAIGTNFNSSFIIPRSSFPIWTVNPKDTKAPPIASLMVGLEAVIGAARSFRVGTAALRVGRWASASDKAPRQAPGPCCSDRAARTATAAPEYTAAPAGAVAHTQPAEASGSDPSSTSVAGASNRFRSNRSAVNRTGYRSDAGSRASSGCAAPPRNNT